LCVIFTKVQQYARHGGDLVNTHRGRMGRMPFRICAVTWSSERQFRRRLKLKTFHWTNVGYSK